MTYTETEKTLELRRQSLMQRRDELDVRLHKIEADLDVEHSKDSQEFAHEIEDDDVLQGMGQAGALEIIKIDAALARIAQGDYGVCVACGADISTKRLDVLPYTPVCKTCAALNDSA